jgi:hypothetical protein
VIALRSEGRYARSRRRRENIDGVNVKRAADVVQTILGFGWCVTLFGYGQAVALGRLIVCTWIASHVSWARFIASAKYI